MIEVLKEEMKENVLRKGGKDNPKIGGNQYIS